MMHIAHIRQCNRKVNCHLNKEDRKQEWRQRLPGMNTWQSVCMATHPKTLKQDAEHCLVHPTSLHCTQGHGPEVISCKTCHKVTSFSTYQPWACLHPKQLVEQPGGMGSGHSSKSLPVSTSASHSLKGPLRPAPAASEFSDSGNQNLNTALGAQKAVIKPHCRRQSEDKKKSERVEEDTISITNWKEITWGGADKN